MKRGYDGLQGATRGYKKVIRFTGGDKGLQEIQEVTWGYKGLQRVTRGYNRLHGATWGSRGYKG